MEMSHVTSTWIEPSGNAGFLLRRRALCLAACQSAVLAAGSARTSAAQDLRKITIGMPSSSLVTAMPRVAHDLGMFAQQGLEPRFVTLDTASVGANALIAGSVDLAIAGPGELIVAQAHNRQIVTISSNYSGLASTLVLSKSVADKTGLSAAAPLADRLKALDGLTIAGVSATSAGPVSFRALAAKVGGASLRFTYLTQQVMPAALGAGSIQGFISSAPYWIWPVVEGTAVAWISGPKGDIPTEYSPTASSIVLTTRQFADANPGVVKGVRAVFDRFRQTLVDRPSEVKASILRVFPNLTTSVVDVFVDTESGAFRPRSLTGLDISKDIEFLRRSGTAVPNLERLDPAAMVYP